MRTSLQPAAILFAAPLLAEYVADAELNLEKALLAATMAERPFLPLFKGGRGGPRGRWAFCCAPWCCSGSTPGMIGS